MLLTQFDFPKGSEESEPPKRTLSKQNTKAHQLFYEQPEMGGMQINAMPPWAQP